MEMVQKKVMDLGVAAYMLMHGYTVVAKSGKAVIFEVEKEGAQEFEKKTMDYLNSEFHRFDSCLMSLKKMNEYN